jgi:PKD repeat protein
VTVTDRGGKIGTAEVTVVVGDPSGPPTVQAAATPRSGAAPLEVRFTSVAGDPEGHAVSTVWDFGDGQQAGGPSITHVYRTPGTYTATVTVTDPDGLTDTDSVQITVTASQGPSQPPPGSNQPPPQGSNQPPPQGSTPPPQGSTLPPQGDVGGEQAARTQITAPKSAKVRAVIRRGLRLKATCVEACRVRSVLRLSGQRVGKSKRVSIKAGKSRTVVIRLDRNVRRNLIAAMRQAGLRSVLATAVTTVDSGEFSRAYPVKVRLRR